MKLKVFYSFMMFILVCGGCSIYSPVEIMDKDIDLTGAKVGLIVTYSPPVYQMEDQLREQFPEIRKQIEKNIARIEQNLAEGFLKAIKLETLYDIEIVDRKRKGYAPSAYQYLLRILVEDIRIFQEKMVFFKARVTITDTRDHLVVYRATFEERPKRGVDFIRKIVRYFPNSLRTGEPSAKQIHWIDPSAPTPSQEDYPNAAAIYLVDERDVNVQIKSPRPWTWLTKYGNLFTRETRHVALKILNERGYQYAEVLIPFDEHTHIERLEARTITKDKRIINVSPDQIYEVDLFPDLIFFSDVKAKKFTFPAVEPGAIIEYIYTVVTESVKLWEEHQFQKPEPVLISRFCLDVPSGMEFKQVFRCPDYLPETFKSKARNLSSWVKRGGYREKSSSKWARKTYQYVLSNLPAIPMEERMPPWHSVGARLVFCSPSFLGEGILNSFQDLGNWYAEMISKSLEADTPVRRKAKEITRDLKTVEEKIRAIYRYIQERFRYVAVELGIGKIVPQSPKEVERNRYGDCKGLSALMIAMLRSIGVKAYPALLKTKDKGELDEEFVALSQFNHMIVCVEKGKERIWLDPTAKSCAFLSLPWQDQGVKALVVKPGGSYLITTPASTAKENSIETEWDVKLYADGRLTCRVQSVFTGQWQFLLREALRRSSDKEQRDWITRHLAQTFPRAQLINYRVSDLKERETPLILSYQFESPNILQKVGDSLLFPLHLRAEIASFTQRNRVHPVIFDYPFNQVDEIRVHLPAGYTVEELPEEVDIETQFGTLKITLTEEQGYVIYRREILWNATVIAASEYEKLCQFQQKITSTQRKNIVLKKSESAVD
jgi:hypothetical protein